MFLCDVIFDEPTEWERLLRSEPEEVSRCVAMNVPLAYGLRSADQVGTFASK